MKVIHFFIVTLVVLLSGCSERGRVFSRLVEADSLLSKEKPDSARLLLDAISPSVLQTDEEKAYYYMLLAHAKYWLYETTASDSVVAFSVDYYTKTKDEEKLARALYYKGVVLYVLGKHERSLKIIKQAELLAEKHHDLSLCTKAFSSICAINIKSANYNKALTYARKTLSLSKATRNNTMQAAAYGVLSDVFTKLDMADSALYYARKSVEYNQYVDDIHKSESLTNLGVCYSNVGKYKDAEHYVLQSISTSRSAHAYYVLGGIYIAQGREQQAWDAWMKALETGGVETKVSVFDYIVEYKKQKGEYREMARWNDSLLLYKDSLKRMQNTEQMLQVQETADKKTELDKSDKLAKRRILIILCVTVVLVLFFAIYSIRKRASLKESLGRMDMVNKINATLKKQLETAENNRQQAIETLQQKLESENEKKISDLIYGRQCLDKLRQGGTMAKWNTKEQKAVIEYYSVLNPKVMEEIRTGYKKLTNYNMMFLITESWDLSDEDKAFLLNTTPGAVRTMRSRLAKKKV